MLIQRQLAAHTSNHPMADPKTSEACGDRRWRNAEYFVECGAAEFEWLVEGQQETIRLLVAKCVVRDAEFATIMADTMIIRREELPTLNPGEISSEHIEPLVVCD